MVKAQIHACGRGKGGGVKLAHGQAEVRAISDVMLGMNLVTHQTGPEGRKVTKLLIEAGQDIKRELYLSFVLDRASAKVLIMASQDGGMDIEEVAEKTPERILKVHVDTAAGIQPYQVRHLAYGLDIPKQSSKPFFSLLSNLYRFFIDKDCSLVEINPLIITGNEDILALDAKVDFDSNGLHRQKDIIELRDPEEEDPFEIEASKYDLNYINLDGNVGNIVNGAGLAMAIISGSSGTGEAKIKAFKENGIHVCENLGKIGKTCKEIFNSKQENQSDDQ